MNLDQKTILKKFGYFLALSILASFVYLLWASNRSPEKNKIPIEPENKTQENNILPQDNAAVNDIDQQKKSAGATRELPKDIATENIPAKILIDVPFTSQAPFGKWDAYHEEACEEASLVMIEYYLQNKKLTPQIA